MAFYVLKWNYKTTYSPPWTTNLSSFTASFSCSSIPSYHVCLLRAHTLQFHKGSSMFASSQDTARTAMALSWRHILGINISQQQQNLSSLALSNPKHSNNLIIQCTKREFGKSDFRSHSTKQMLTSFTMTALKECEFKSD